MCTEEYNAEGPIELSNKVDFMNMGMGQHLKHGGRFFTQNYLSFHSSHHSHFVEGALLFDSFVSLL